MNICHVTIQVLDKEKAKNFYEDIFGWEINFDALPNYGLTTGLDVSVGFPVVDEIENQKLGIYVEVDSIEDTLQRINNSGGNTINTKNKISDEIGFGATFTDCFGNEIGLFCEE